MAIRIRPRSKYGAKPVVIDGIRFASTKEGKRYGELRMLEKAGEIRALTVQPSFELNVNGVRIGIYRGDFRYETRSDRGTCRGCWRSVVEDVKSPATRTALYLWKVKHLRAQDGIEVTEV